MAVKDLFPAATDLRTWAWYKKKLVKHFLPLGFLAAFVWGLVWPWPGSKIASWEVDGALGEYSIVKTINFATIFVISGLLLKSDEAVASVKKPRGLIFGLITILGITPMLAFGAAKIPYGEKAFATGLAIFCCMPTTLSSGVALVLSANGNVALGLLLTVGSNLIGIFTIPFLLQGVFSEQKIELDTVKLLVKLILTIFLPLIAGKLVRDLVGKIRNFVNRNYTAMAMVSNTSYIMIVWQTVSYNQDQIVSVPFGQLCLVELGSIGVHVAFIVANYVMIKCIVRLNRPDYKAALICGSQKTLPVAITVIEYFDPRIFGDHGLMAIPAILGHLSQIFFDSFVVLRMNHNDEKRAAQEGDAAVTDKLDGIDAPKPDGKVAELLPSTVSSPTGKSPRSKVLATASLKSSPGDSGDGRIPAVAEPSAESVRSNEVAGPAESADGGCRRSDDSSFLAAAPYSAADSDSGAFAGQRAEITPGIPQDNA